MRDTVPIRVVIAGGRDFDIERNTRYLTLFVETMRLWLAQHRAPITIGSGTARGADTAGIILAREKAFPLKKFPADWDRFGKSAGYRRNEQMAEWGTHLIAFWDGESRGTQHMIDLATRYGLDVTVVNYADDQT